MSRPVKPRIVCLMGPTAAGKTQLAIDLLTRFPMTIISVDSAMIYRGMDIGTAKPSAAVLARAPHRLINIVDPASSYSAATFRADALREIAALIAQQRIPLLTGGTMMYFNVLQQGLADLPAAHAPVRAALTAEANRLGWHVLHQRLQAVDPPAAARIHPHDAQRIQRALEIFVVSGKSMSAWQAAATPALADYDIINLAVAPAERNVLHERIAHRFEEMLALGFLSEVTALQARGDLTKDMPAMRAVGYRQAWSYLQNECTFDEMRTRAIAATRQLAKRQLTWLRHWANPLTWFDSTDPKCLSEIMLYLERCNIV